MNKYNKLEKQNLKPITWIGCSHDDLKKMPQDVIKEFGFALYQAQCGGKGESVKPLTGFSGAGVLEVVENCNGDTFRAVYTVRFVEAVYVLHVFQKKSKHGISTPPHDINLIKLRLKKAEEIHRETLTKGKKP